MNEHDTGMGIVARQSIKGSLANYIGVAIGFFTTFFVLTDYLTQEEIGFTRVLVDAATLFAALAQLGTNSTIIRYFPYFNDRRRNHGIFGLSVLFPLVGFFLVALVLFVFRSDITELYAERSPLIKDYFHLLLPLTFFVLYITVCESNANVLMRITIPKLIREVGIRVFNLMCYLLYGKGVISFDLFVVLFTASYGVALLLNLCYLVSLKRISFRIDLTSVGRHTLTDMVRYSLFMSIVVLANNSQLLGSLFIGAQEGLALTGVYTIAFFIANVVEVPGRSLSAISRPLVAAAAKDNDWGEVSSISRNVSLHQFMVSVFILVFIWINLDALFDIIPNGDGYRDGKWVVLILGLAKIVNSTLSIGTDVLNYSKHFRLSIVFVLILSVSIIALNYWLVGVWSINGAAAATLFAYLLYYAGLLLYIGLKLKVTPFSVAQLKVVLIAAGIVAADMIWSHTISPIFPDGRLAAVADVGTKTLVLAAAATAVLYKLKISQHVNAIIDKAMHIGRK